jgi:hypothetical protein
MYGPPRVQLFSSLHPHSSHYWSICIPLGKAHMTLTHIISFLADSTFSPHQILQFLKGEFPLKKTLMCGSIDYIAQLYTHDLCIYWN